MHLPRVTLQELLGILPKAISNVENGFGHPWRWFPGLYIAYLVTESPRRDVDFCLRDTHTAMKLHDSHLCQNET
jgi:hypothetical protein